MPSIGDLATLEEIRERRRTMKTATDCFTGTPDRLTPEESNGSE